MSFLPNRQKLALRAVAAATAGGSKLQHSAFANTVLAPVLANHIPFIMTPYLGLRGRLSQIWINRWTILLILVLVRTLLSIVSLERDIGSAQTEALSACTGVEAAGSALASMPHYLALGVNQLTASGVEKAVNGLMQMLLLTVTGVENLIVFVVNMFTSTYLCLITLVVSGALHAAIALIEDITGFLNTTLQTIGSDLQSTVNTFESALNDAISGINDVGSIFGGNGHTIPTLNIDSQISALDNLQLPSNFTSDLQTLNNSIPSFAQVQNFTDNAIRLPFELIKNLLNESLPRYTMDASVFPVPEKQSLSFCSSSNGINGFFTSLFDLTHEARKVAIAVLIILAVLVCAPMSYLEIRRYRKMERRAALFKEGLHDAMDVVYMASRPTSSGVGLSLASTFKATRRQQLVRWAIAYATTVPAIFVLSLGLAGLFSCLCRYIILVLLTKEVPALAEEVADYAGTVVRSLEATSEQWANGTNTAILGLNEQINSDVFGWVNISTTAVNNTLNVFINESISVLNATFGGTILYDPVVGLFNCLIGLKVASVEKGLTWVSDNAHVDFPLLPNNTFSLGAAASITNDSSSSSPSFLATPGNSTTDALSTIVDAVVNHYANSIRTEALISTGVVAVWVIVALIGVFRALWLFYGKGGQDSVDARHTIAYSNRTSPSFVSAEVFPAPTLPRVDEKSPSIPMGPIPHVEVQPPSSRASPATQADSPSLKPSPLRFHESAAATANATADAGNTYRGAAYTLAPRPMPGFDGAASGLPPSPQSRLQPGQGAPRFATTRDVGQRPGLQRTGDDGGLDRSAFHGLG